MDIKVRANTKGKNKEDYPKDNKRLDDFFNLTNNKRFRENESNSDDNDRVSNHNISSSLPINLIDDSFEDPILEDNSQSKKSKKAKRNRDSCSICRTGGELILCDNCPKSFHKECLKIKSVPEGDWFCPSCL